MPADRTTGLRPALRSVRATATTHPGLWMSRYLTHQSWDDKRAPHGYAKDRATEARDALIDAVEQNPLPPGYASAFDRWESELASDGSRIVRGYGTVGGRVVIGLGAKGAAEFGITLHHTWGVPILPGSSLKGIATVGADRYLASDEWRRRDKPAEARRGGPNAFDALFGDVEEQGAVIFHDAWFVPASGGGKNGLHRDILTVHHPEYYQKGGELTDADNPIPVPFVSASGTFLVALELHPSLDPATGARWLHAAWNALRVGLSQHGIGAKTRASYGRVELVDWSETSVAKALEQDRVDEEKETLAQATPKERHLKLLQGISNVGQLYELLRQVGKGQDPWTERPEWWSDDCELEAELRGCAQAAVELELGDRLFKSSELNAGKRKRKEVWQAVMTRAGDA